VDGSHHEGIQPSGADRATNSLPMMPLAPTLFSTTMGVPSSWGQLWRDQSRVAIGL